MSYGSDAYGELAYGQLPPGPVVVNVAIGIGLAGALAGAATQKPFPAGATMAAAFGQAAARSARVPALETIGISAAAGASRQARSPRSLSITVEPGESAHAAGVAYLQREVRLVEPPGAYGDFAYGDLGGLIISTGPAAILGAEAGGIGMAKQIPAPTNAGLGDDFGFGPSAGATEPAATSVGAVTTLPAAPIAPSSLRGATIGDLIAGAAPSEAAAISGRRATIGGAPGLASAQTGTGPARAATTVAAGAGAAWTEDAAAAAALGLAAGASEGARDVEDIPLGEATVAARLGITASVRAIAARASSALGLLPGATGTPASIAGRVLQFVARAATSTAMTSQRGLVAGMGALFGTAMRAPMRVLLGWQSALTLDAAGTTAAAESTRALLGADAGASPSASATVEQTQALPVVAGASGRPDAASSPRAATMGAAAGTMARFAVSILARTLGLAGGAETAPSPRQNAGAALSTAYDLPAPALPAPVAPRQTDIGAALDAASAETADAAAAQTFSAILATAGIRFFDLRFVRRLLGRAAAGHFFGRGTAGNFAGRAAAARFTGNEMAVLHQRYSFAQGDTWPIYGSLHYADGTPFNLGAGAAIVWELQDEQGNVILSFSLLDGQIAVTDLNGPPADDPPWPGPGPYVPHHVLITVTPAQSAAIAPGIYRDQLRATDPSGFVSTQAAGSIEVTKSFFNP